jgi:hypothetical protein
MGILYYNYIYFVMCLVNSIDFIVINDNGRKVYKNKKN